MTESVEIGTRFAGGRALIAKSNKRRWLVIGGEARVGLQNCGGIARAIRIYI
jgi:hypothetical protein